jgi:3',5'-cyclic AMP phosphodiesterase CpdA
MSILLQVSDAHFGTEQEPVVRALVALSARLLPEVIVLSGDITQRARGAQFEAARQFFQELGRPLVAIPGNHDIPLYNLAARIFSPYGNYKRAFGDELEPVFESEALLVLGVNTTRPTRHKDGEISQQQIARIDQRLRQARREQLRVVVTHQPVHVIRAEDEENLLHGHELAVRSWSDAGADIIMGGHIHLPYVRPLSDRFTNLPRKTWAVQAGTAVSWRIRGMIPNSVNVVKHSGGDLVCSVERWDYDVTTNGFRCVNADLLPLDRPTS